MRTITTTDELAAFCAAARDEPYVTLDTEFLREHLADDLACLLIDEAQFLKNALAQRSFAAHAGLQLEAAWRSQCSQRTVPVRVTVPVPLRPICARAFITLYSRSTWCAEGKSLPGGLRRSTQRCSPASTR